jgi:hypothetical protein
VSSHAGDIHVHIHFDQMPDGSLPAMSASGAIPEPHQGDAAPWRPPPMGAASALAGSTHAHGGPTPPDLFPMALAGLPSLRVGGPLASVDPPCLPLQPLTRLVAFDDSLADLVTELEALPSLGAAHAACWHGHRATGLSGWPSQPLAGAESAVQKADQLSAVAEADFVHGKMDWRKHGGAFRCASTSGRHVLSALDTAAANSADTAAPNPVPRWSPDLPRSPAEVIHGRHTSNGHLQGAHSARHRLAINACAAEKPALRRWLAVW